MNKKTTKTNSKLPVSLDQVSIKTPCQMDWDLMASRDDSGEDRIRFCRRCKKNVYNLSGMNESAAMRLLDSNEPICARIFRRPDGTIVTSACPSPTPLDVSGRKRFQFSLAALIVLVTASAGVAASAPWIGEKIRPLWDRLTRKPAQPPITAPMMGEVMITPAPVNDVLTEEMGDVCVIEELE